jgi:PAS domain S-box-containing protein
MQPLHVRSTDRRRAAEHAVNRILAASTSLEDAAAKILEVVGATLGWDCGAFWGVLRKKLRCVATWQAPDNDLEAFLAATREVTFERGSGLPGRVWATGAPEWRPDIRRDGVLSRPGAEAAAERLRAGIGFPVTAGGEVLAVMEFFGPAEEAPEPEWLEMFEFLGAQVGQFVERHAATRALRESNDRMRAVVDNMLEGLITISDRNVIEQVNRAAAALFGYTAGELVGQHLKILMPQTLAGQADQFLKDVAQRALGRLTEWDGRRKSGEIFRFELSLFSFQTPEGRHFAGHVRDISERKKLEKMKQEFVATVSHELRTPLTSIRGSLSLLAGGALGDLPDEARDVVGIAERNTIRLITLINDILDLERFEAGKVQLKLEEVPLSAVLERSLESVRGFAEQQGIAINAPATDARVEADADRLVQVLVNLLSNAVKYSPPGGTVEVAVAERDGQAEVRVQDRGRGIPAHRREAIFERFEQVESSDARQKGGTGLGLAICRAIVEQHGGKIGVESQPGKGSTFWFRVPSRRAPARTEDDAFLSAVSGLRGDARDVLLVDDDSALLGVLTRQLLQAGIPVRTARTAREAIAEARTPPALVVIDVALPDGSGYDVIEALRARPESSDLPVLIYTALDLSPEDQERLALGPTRMLIKSKATDAEFRAAVTELLQPVEETGRAPRRSS